MSCLASHIHSCQEACCRIYGKIVEAGIEFKDINMAWKLLAVIVALNGSCNAIPRTNVVIKGTTVGPDWARPRSGQSK